MEIRNKENVLEAKECIEIIKKKLSKDKMENYSIIEYELIPLDSTTGFMGQYFTLKATVAPRQSAKDTRTINFFTKIPPPMGTASAKYNEEHGSFKKEIDLYNEVFPVILNGLEQSSIPECFLGLGEEVLVLEDMSAKGFTMINKHTPFDYNHCRIIMKALAKFHGKSMIFEEIYKKNLYEKFSYCMHETLWPTREGKGGEMLVSAIKGVLSMIDMLDELDEFEKIKFKDKFMAMTINHREKLAPSKKFKNVLCHGDLWANNVLFKYDDVGKPEACCLIDFQLARYNPPAHDILLFLQFSTTRELREKHCQELFKIYYDNLSSSLIDAHLDPGKVFSFTEFCASIEELRVFSMIHGILNTPVMLLASQAVDKCFNQYPPEYAEAFLYVDRTPLVCEQFNEVEMYRERMIDGLLELYDELKR